MHELHVFRMGIEPVLYGNGLMDARSSVVSPGQLCQR